MNHSDLKNANKALDYADRQRIEKKLAALIRHRYNHRDFLVVEQVRSGLGNRVRIADAIALGAWKSRDLSIHGLEIKADRADWLSELEKPEKAEEIAQFCDFWWIVAADATIVRPEELPANWGLYIPHGKDPRTAWLEVSVAAKPLSPKPIDREFLTMILKRLRPEDIVRPPDELLKAEYDRGHSEGLDQGLKRSNDEKDNLIEWLNRQLFMKSQILEKLSAHTKAPLETLDTESLEQLGELFRVFRPIWHKGISLDDLLEAVKVIRSGSSVDFARVEHLYGTLKERADKLVEFLAGELQKVTVARAHASTLGPMLAQGEDPKAVEPGAK